MKKLIVALSLVSVSAMANVECTKEGRYYRPTNQVAKDIAKALRVKTCTGGKFKAMVKKLGMTSNVPETASFNKSTLLKKYSAKK